MNQSDKFIKTPILVSVEFASMDGALETLEGIVPYKQGDALLTGLKNERWPVVKSLFDKNYNPIEGIKRGQDGSYQKRSILVSAVQAQDNSFIRIKNNNIYLACRKGDWIITAEDGAQWVVAEDIFIKTYKKINNSSGMQ